MVKVFRDKVENNKYISNNLRIPRFSIEPPVSQVGQIYYNTNDETFCWSTGINEWNCVGGCDLHLCGNLEVDGNALIHGNLVVDGNITGNNVISNTVTTNELTVDGNSVLCGDVEICGNLVVNGNITGEDNITGNSLNVNGPSDLCGDVRICEDLVVDGDVTVGGDSTIQGDQTIEGSQHICGDLDVCGETTLECVVADNINTITLEVGECIETLCLTVDDVAHISELEVCGDTTIGGDVNVGGDVTVVGDITGDNVVSNTVTTKELTVQGDSVLCGEVEGGNLVVDGDVAVAGIVTSNNVVSNTVTTKELEVQGDSVLCGEVEVCGNLVVDGDLAVNGDVTGNNVVSNTVTTNNLNVQGDSVLCGEVEVCGNLVVTGNVYAPNITPNTETITLTHVSGLTFSSNLDLIVTKQGSVVSLIVNTVISDTHNGNSFIRWSQLPVKYHPQYKQFVSGMNGQWDGQYVNSHIVSVDVNGFVEIYYSSGASTTIGNVFLLSNNSSIMYMI